MASLTPGVLQKLLENVGNKDVKVVGEHRTALLQVIGIVPSLDDDPWKSRGFYLRVSDSVHSAYVSVLDTDVELILNDKIQLGQFMYVTRLDPGSPVPVIRGLKVVPRRRPCIGEPEDLISSDVLIVRKNVESKKGKKNFGMEKRLLKGNVKGKAKKATEMEVEDVKTRRLSLSNDKDDGVEMRRLSLDSARKGWDWSIGGANVKRIGNSKTRDTSMFPDTVLARKRPPVADSASKHANISPLKNKNVIISPKSLSKPFTKDLKSSNREAPTDHLKKVEVLAHKKPPMDDSASKLTIISPLRNNNVIVSPKSLGKPFTRDLKSSNHEALPDHLRKVDVSFRNWSDSKVSWDSLPAALCDLGKEIKSQRNKSFVSAVHAMEEASTTEGAIRCMSLFAELCESSEKDSPGAVVERFLNLYENMQNSAVLIDVLVKSRSEAKEKYSSGSKFYLPNFHGNFANKSASTWVQAAIETDLSKFSLLRKDGEKDADKQKNSFYVVIERTGNEKEAASPPSKNKRTLNIPEKILQDSKTKAFTLGSRRHHFVTKGTSSVTEEWPMGNGLKDAAALIEKLLATSHGWFLNYLENYLNQGFWPKANESDSETSILGHLKRVNKWLDDTMPSSSESNERISMLRRKLYGFLLDHVDSAGSRR